LIGFALWARLRQPPGTLAFAIETFDRGLAWCGLCWWATYVWPGTMIFIGPGHGLYMAATGWALRRFARRWPLALSAPLAWMLLETIRAQLEPPFGLPWMRLGTFLHDQSWIAGSARVWGRRRVELGARGVRRFARRSRRALAVLRQRQGR
jgi:hypothetical protein